MEIKEKFAHPPRESFPYILLNLEENPILDNLFSRLSNLKNHCAGFIIQASSKHKGMVRKIAEFFKKENIPFYLVLPSFTPFTSSLQAIRLTAKEGGIVEIPFQGKLQWVGAVSNLGTAQPNIIELKQFVEGNVLKWSVPAGSWEIVIISSSEQEIVENPSEVISFWIEELSEFLPPLAGFYIPSLNFHPFPWREDLPEEFQRRRGYPFLPSFPALVLNLDGKSGKFRYDFRRTVYEIWEESIKGIVNNLQRKGLTLLSVPDTKEHCWGELFLLSSQLPAIAIRPSDNRFIDEFVAALLSSFLPIVDFSRKWSASIEELKNWTDLLSVYGVAGSILYLPASRPDTQLYEQLLLPTISQYQARLRFLFQSFPTQSKVAMLLPRLSFWVHQRLGEDDEYFRSVERDIFYLSELLHKIHYQFSFVDEDELPNLTGIHTLVLPSIAVLKRSTIQWLEKFNEGGGNIIALGMFPICSEEGVDLNLQNAIRAIFKVNIEDINKLYLLSAKEGIGSAVAYAVGRIHPLSGGRIYAYQPAVNPDRGEALRQTRQLFRQCAPPDLDSLIEEVLCHPRRGNLFLIYNDGEKEVKLNALLPVQGIPFKLEAKSGKIVKIPVYSLMEDGRTIIREKLPSRFLSIIQFDRGEELHIDQANFAVEELRVGEGQIEIIGCQVGPEPPFAVIEHKGERKEVEGKAFPILPSIPLPVEWEIEPISPNVLPLRNWRFQRKTSWFSQFFIPKRPQPGWPSLPPDYQPNGLTWYQTTFSLREMVSELFLWLEYPPEVVYINGKKLKGGKEFALNDYVMEGENYIYLLFNHNKYPSMPYIMLKGNFSLYFLEGEWRIGKLKRILQIGSWTEQGFPFYVGTIKYRTSFFLPSLYLGKKAVLSLGQVKDMVEVFVNNNRVDFLFSSPWEVEIEGFLSEGENELDLLITNCPPETVGEGPHQSGLLAPSQVLIFNRVCLRLPL